ncbi:MAG: DUF2017 family protein [Ilumatobacteraceae bacterium]
MPRAPKPPIQRTRTGFRVNLDIEERQLIHRLLAELRALMDGSRAARADHNELNDPVDVHPGEDERLRRLFPSAYHQAQDREMDDEFRRLMHDDLITSRLAGLDLVGNALAPDDLRSPELSETQLTAFLQALNGVRLVLGTILDVSEDHDAGDVRDDHPLVGEYHLYDFLSWVLDSSVRALQS